VLRHDREIQEPAAAEAAAVIRCHIERILASPSFRNSKSQ
jgi:hypothetical protein